MIEVSGIVVGVRQERGILLLVQVPITETVVVRTLPDGTQNTTTVVRGYRHYESEIPVDRTLTSLLDTALGSLGKVVKVQVQDGEIRALELA